MDGKMHGEGEIYKILTVAEREFTILYGYYSESEREIGFPTPILPDFTVDPLYTEDGWPFSARIQDACEHYAPTNGNGDGWCADCCYYSDKKEDIGICRCEHRRKICR